MRWSLKIGQCGKLIVSRKKGVDYEQEKATTPAGIQGPRRLAALKNEENELAVRFGAHPTMINNWKRALVERATDIFYKGHKALQDWEA